MCVIPVVASNATPFLASPWCIHLIRLDKSVHSIPAILFWARPSAPGAGGARGRESASTIPVLEALISSRYRVVAFNDLGEECWVSSWVEQDSEISLDRYARWVSDQAQALAVWLQLWACTYKCCNQLHEEGEKLMAMALVWVLHTDICHDRLQIQAI